MPDPRFESWDDAVAKAKLAAKPTQPRARPVLAEAPAAPTFRRSRVPLVAAVSAGFVASAALGGGAVWLLTKPGRVAAQAPPSRMPGYAAAELARQIAINQWVVTPHSTPDEKAAIERLVAGYTRHAESLPADHAVEALLREVAGYYDGDMIRIWMNCADAVHESKDQNVTQKQVLESFAQALRPLRSSKLHKTAPRRFVVFTAIVAANSTCWTKKPPTKSSSTSSLTSDGNSIHEYHPRDRLKRTALPGSC
jgi:hypothetical protein